jgi:hypothetical protein
VAPRMYHSGSGISFVVTGVTRHGIRYYFKISDLFQTLRRFSEAGIANIWSARVHPGTNYSL